MGKKAGVIKHKIEDVSDVLVINRKPDETSLTKNQKIFNRLSKKISELQKELIDINDKLQSLTTLYNKEVASLRKIVSMLQVSLAHLIMSVTEKEKVAKKVNEDIKFYVYSLLDQAFEFVEPDEAAKDLYDKVSEVSFDEEKKQMKDELMNSFKEELFEQFGVDVNLEDLENDRLDNFSKLKEKIASAINDRETKQSTKKRTKRQIAEEEKKTEAENLKVKSIRNIYTTLAKVLHPDTETDELLRKEKEEIMKQVTIAYSNKDLQTLLKLEMQWVMRETNHLENLSEAKLGVYISALKEQISNLEHEKYMTYSNPRYMIVAHLAMLNEVVAKREIRKEIKGIKEMEIDIQDVINEIKQHKSPIKIIKKLVKQFEEDEMYDLEYFAKFY
jgi:glycerol-3-phosphate cytidylyltransferase-like family protein